MVRVRQIGLQISPALIVNKTEENKRRRPFSESFKEDGIAKKTEELYAARITPKVQRHFHSAGASPPRRWSDTTPDNKRSDFGKGCVEINRGMPQPVCVHPRSRRASKSADGRNGFPF